jgi:hypothetical protein
LCGIEQSRRALDVDDGVACRICEGRTYTREAGQMKHAIDPSRLAAIASNETSSGLTICDARLFDFDPLRRIVARQRICMPPLEALRIRRIREVIEDADRVTAIEQSAREVMTDEANTSRDEPPLHLHLTIHHR